MTALDHLFSCEKRLALAKQDLRAAAEKLSTAGNSGDVFGPFVYQCRARLSDTLPDDAWIMECKGEVVTAGQARALVEWWDGGEVNDDSELQKLRAFYEAAGPLMDYLKRNTRFSKREIDAAFAAYDAVRGEA